MHILSGFSAVPDTADPSLPVQKQLPIHRDILLPDGPVFKEDTFPVPVKFLLIIIFLKLGLFTTFLAWYTLFIFKPLLHFILISLL